MEIMICRAKEVYLALVLSSISSPLLLGGMAIGMTDMIRCQKDTVCPSIGRDV